MRSLQHGRLKLIWSAYGDTLELYDVEKDPNEYNNLYRRRTSRALALFESLKRAPTYWARRVPIDYSPSTFEQLKALGYVDTTDQK